MLPSLNVYLEQHSAEHKIFKDPVKYDAFISVISFT